ncbi:TRAP transporter substrate-binding protein DctP [Paucibacter sp. O1-1]|nr:TRAP transporter substrate-binding protein DctP [Paucibacter sp. O1-1]MDA3827963.1 TRAP transporter substrate-binding protein DctP [Paucibacter sp. O1-1]
MKDDVDKATGGKLKITVHANASLFKAPEIKRAVQGGLRLQIGEVLISNFANEWAPFGADALPFLADSYDESVKLWKVQKPLFEKKLGEQGLMPLYAVPRPPQGVFSKKALASGADMKGIKFRAYNPATSRLAELLGAQPVTVQAAEVSQAFATGVTDKHDLQRLDRRRRQAARACEALVRHPGLAAQGPMLVNKAAFAALDKPTQDAVLKAAAAAEERGLAASKKANGESLDKLRAGGMQILLPPAALSADLKKAGEVMLKEWLDKAGADGKALVDAYRR